MGFPFLVQVGDTVTDIIIQNYEKTKKEILVDYDKDSLLKIGNRMKLGKSVSMFQELK